MDAETIKNSIECRWRLKQVKLYAWTGLIVPLVSLLFTFLSTGMGKFDPADLGEVIIFTFSFVAIPYALIILPFLLYNLYRYWQLLKNYQNYTVHTVKLEKPHTSFLYKNAVYYTVTIGGWNVNTSPIFSDGFLSSFTLDEYSGKTVRVLYDDQKQRVYLIDKV